MILLIHWLSNKIVWENYFFVPEETNAAKTSPFPTGNANKHFRNAPSKGRLFLRSNIFRHLSVTVFPE